MAISVISVKYWVINSVSFSGSNFSEIVVNPLISEKKTVKFFLFVSIFTSISPEKMTYVIEDIFERHMKGENPENIELMFRRVYSSGFTQRPDPTIIGAFSGLEIACWDILGKSCDKPIYSLLGGAMQKRIRSYTYLYPLPHHDHKKFWSSPDMAVESAREMLKLGFTAIKFDPAGPYTIRGGHQPSMFDIDLSIEFCKALRQTVGNKADLLFGTCLLYTSPSPRDS